VRRMRTFYKRYGFCQYPPVSLKDSAHIILRIIWNHFFRHSLSCFRFPQGPPIAEFPVSGPLSVFIVNDIDKLAYELAGVTAVVLKSPQPPFLKGGRGGISNDFGPKDTPHHDYFLLSFTLVLRTLYFEIRTSIFYFRCSNRAFKTLLAESVITVPGPNIPTTPFS